MFMHSSYVGIVIKVSNVTFSWMDVVEVSHSKPTVALCSKEHVNIPWEQIVFDCAYTAIKKESQSWSKSNVCFKTASAQQT